MNEVNSGRLRDAELTEAHGLPDTFLVGQHFVGRDMVLSALEYSVFWL